MYVDSLHTVSISRPMHAVRHPVGGHLFDALALQAACLPCVLGTLGYFIPHEMNISIHSDSRHHSARFSVTTVFIMWKLIFFSLLLSTNVEALAITKAQEPTNSASLDERKEKRTSSSSSLAQGSSVDTTTTFDVEYNGPTAASDIHSTAEPQTQIARASNIWNIMDATIQFLFGVIIILFQLALIFTFAVPAYFLAQLGLETLQAYFCHGYSQI